MRNNMENFNDRKCSGWDAITNACEKIYPDQKSPKHYGTLIKWAFGGPDPLDGISVYDAGECWHFVTYGLSELYEKETDDQEYSGYGMEFTFKLKKLNVENEEDEIKNICHILQVISRSTFETGEIFKPYEYIYTGQTNGIDLNGKSNIVGFITIPDTKLDAMDTPNGKVEFVEFIGITEAELEKVKTQQVKVKALYEELNNDITDYNRNSIY